jgi:GT2 family glycosyltransferase
MIEFFLIMISVVITNFNGKHILETYFKNNIEFLLNLGLTDIILADDASSDDSITYATLIYPDLTVVSHKKNVGLPQNCNDGIHYAKHDIILLLNNDMLLKKLDVDYILNLFQHDDVFACAPKIMRKHDDGSTMNESPNYGFFKGGWFSSELSENVLTHSIELIHGCKPILWGCGGGVFYHKQRFLDIGSFDKHFYTPSYGDDLDLSYRAWKLGFCILYTNEAELFHGHSSTFKMLFSKEKIQEIHLANHYYFMWKNISDWDFLVSHFITVFIKIITFQIKDLKALVKAFKKLPYIFQYRRNANNHKSDKMILSYWNAMKVS